MKIAFFYHSLLSDWNHGNAHFLRGIVWELKQRGHDITVFEPEDGWSLSHLLSEHGEKPLSDFRRHYPGLESSRYRLDSIDLRRALDGADLVLVHEWNERELVGRIGTLRKSDARFRLLFHDTHHRAITAPQTMTAYDLSGYDGVLAYGKAIANIYLRRAWARRAWVWHEAADARVFHPVESKAIEGDLIWIGNWGDGERSAELREFLIEPIKALKLNARIYGVRYPADALRELKDAGIEYGGWLPNYRVPELFARFRVTVHIQRRPYARALPGIPTIRPFEALGCGIPLVCSPWNDIERLFTPGKDFLIARNGAEMQRCLSAILDNHELAHRLAAHGRQTILQRHTCAHRADELLSICHFLEREAAARPPVSLGLET
jgi:spore maturation protein CgeB